MRSITIRDLELQFDGDLVTEGTPEAQASEIIDSINRELAGQFPDACPQILVQDAYQVKAEDYENEGDEG